MGYMFVFGLLVGIGVTLVILSSIGKRQLKKSADRLDTVVRNVIEASDME